MSMRPMAGANAAPDTLMPADTVPSACVAQREPSDSSHGAMGARKAFTGSGRPCSETRTRSSASAGSTS